MTNWDEAPLGELLEVLIDHRGKTPKKVGGADFTPSGVPVVSAIHIKGGRINWGERERYVPRWMFEKWMPVRLRRGDVLLTSEAPLGQVAQVETDDDLVLSQRLFALRGKPDRLDSTYLRYFLEAPAGQERLLSRASGTTVVGIRQAELVKIKVPLPPLAEQRRIAAVLGAIDDLIETNRRTWQQVREMSEMVYTGLASLTSDSQLVGSVARVSEAKTKPGTGTIRYVDIAALGDGTITIPEPIDWLDAPSRARMLASDGATLWSTVRPNRRAHALLVECPANLVISTGIAVVEPQSIGPAELFAALDRQEFVEYLVSRAEGSAYPAVRAADFRDVPIPRLSNKDAARFEQLLWPLWVDAHAGLRDNERLTRTRDELLPLLMSGRVRVESVLKEAA